MDKSTYRTEKKTNGGIDSNVSKRPGSLQSTSPEPANDDNGNQMGRSALMLSIGNVAGRILGLLREMVIAAYFGATGEVSAFRVASQVPTLIYDLLAGGMLSAALVPTLSEYAAAERREAFVKLAGSLLSLFAILLALIVLLLELFVPQVAQLMARFEDPALLQLTQQLLRFILPAVWLISMAGVVTGVLYAQNRFFAPAMAAAIFNLGIVVATPILAPQLGALSMVVGVLLGSTAQLLLMCWDLRRFLREVALPLSFRIVARHPALRKMVLLYLPIAGVTLVSSAQVILDRRLASATGEQSIAWMQNATTLQQLPLGLISVAIGLAALPQLSRFFADKDEARYRATLGKGLRLILLLIVPAAVGLWMLGEPITRLIFERRAFTPADTAQVLLALNVYVVGMVFAAIDHLLNYGFYARNNTLLPSLAGVASVLIYVVVAYGLVNKMGFLGLVWADTIKHGSHVIFMGFALWYTVGRLWVGVTPFLLKILAAALSMAALIGFGRQFFTSNFVLLDEQPLLVTDLSSLILFGAGGLLVYGTVLYLLRVDEALSAIEHLRKRMARS